MKEESSKSTANSNFRFIQRWMMRGLLLVLLVFVGASWYVAGQLIAPAHALVGSPPADLKVETFFISSKSGTEIVTWSIPCEGAKGTILLLHPIRGNRLSMLERARLLHDAGYATVLVDLQAHGESQGKYITAGYLERLDVIAVVDWIRSRTPDQKIGVIGCSLGGAAALLASPLQIDALVLESVYPSITQAVHDRVEMRLGPLHHIVAPALLMQLKPRLGISPAKLRPIDHIGNVACPVLIASGDQDLHTTLPETKRLFEAARAPKDLLIFEGAAHVDLLTYAPEKYRKEVLGFLDRQFAKRIPSLQPPLSSFLRKD